MPKRTKFGVYAYNQAPRDADHVDVGRRLVDRGVQAEAKGFDDVFVIEHVGSDEYAYYEPLTVLTSFAEHTDRVTLGTGITLTPFYHPIRLAQRIATLDNLSDGRFVFGPSTGYREREFEAFEIPYDERLPRTLEAIDIVERLWTEERVSHDGGRFSFEDVTIYPRPLQAGGPPIWLGLHGEWGIEYIARNGYTWWSAGMLPTAVLREKTDHYADALAEQGSSIDEVELPSLIEISVAADYETARANVREPMLEKYREYVARAGKDVKGGKGGPHLTNNPTLRELEDPSELTFDMLEEIMVIGGPEEAVEQLETYADMGIDHFVLRPALLSMDESKVRQTIDLVADEVVPHFRD